MATSELNALVLQGGGALGAYQAGAFSALDEAGFSFDWIAGISIGAINAALICGNRDKDRVPALQAFWKRITSNLPVSAPFWTPAGRRAYSEMAAAEVTLAGAPGFFRPRMPSAFWPFLPDPSLSFYDTTPLEATLNELVDFDRLNATGPRLCVGATDVETGNFRYFDSRTTRIDARHIMASGALPPGFPPVEIDGRWYWDGGLVSNTPLQYVMEQAEGDTPLCVFQVDLFNARGGLPVDVIEVQQRQKDIQYSSRTRLTTDRYRQLHALSAAADRLAAKLPDALKDDPDLALLRHAGPSCPVTLVHLIHRKEGFEGSGKDYEFSRPSMSDHWAAGIGDVTRTLSHPSWKSRRVEADGLHVFDLGTPES
ncbi:patatin-like phospholipase family protein [Rhodobacter sp. NTK016B]|uniref:patatin-like phospholipase family protein n=1 Tax=Rhodobacter sp. NTK016B TaxID=2759676 RepID=UPI001A8CE9EB|nr:patatin-like phospholipase family protein [Rhodobacter sp. NTK016B]MBN8292133.1 patatin-like phospholipase family protein [Rhodobacter sp. NTK016B]